MKLWYHEDIWYDIEYDIQYDIMACGSLRSAATLGSPAGGTSIWGMFYVSTTKVVERDLKQWGQVARFGPK